MLHFKRILCPVDFSEYSDRALKYAEKLASRFKAQLYVQHVIEDLAIMAPDIYAAFTDLQSMRVAYRQEIIERLQESLLEDVEGHPIVSQGGPNLEILRAAQQKEVDLIVMGTHGRKGLGRMVIGSVAEDVVKKADCPVLTICHLAYETNWPLDFRRVLVAVDFSEHSLRALDYAKAWAQDFQSELYLLHVIEKPFESARRDNESDSDFLEQTLAATRGRLAQMIPDSLRRACKVETIAKIGNPRHEIARIAQVLDADIVIMGVVGHGALSETLFGSTTYQVIRTVTCPVLTVRGCKSNGKK